MRADTSLLVSGLMNNRLVEESLDINHYIRVVVDLHGLCKNVAHVTLNLEVKTEAFQRVVHRRKCDRRRRDRHKLMFAHGELRLQL